MKRRKKSADEQLVKFPVWTYPQAERAIPYVRSVMKSVREIFLSLQQARHLDKCLADRPGRPDTQTLLAQDVTSRDVDRLEEELADGVSELLQLNIPAVDPVNGLALIPFVQDDRLAWFVFELFEKGHIHAWRYHDDDKSVRRPLKDGFPDKSVGAVVV